MRANFPFQLLEILIIYCHLYLSWVLFAIITASISYFQSRKKTPNVPMLVAMEIMENVNHCKYVAPGCQKASRSGERAGVVSFMHPRYSSVTTCVPKHASKISAFICLFFLLPCCTQVEHECGMGQVTPPPTPPTCTHIIHKLIQIGLSHDQYRQ